jgi:hypothetical protein
MDEPILFDSVDVRWTEWVVEVTIRTGDQRALQAILNALNPTGVGPIAVTFSKPKEIF